MKSIGRFPLQPSPLMIAGCRYNTDIVSWEESLPFVIIVKDLDIKEDAEPFPEANRKILKPFHGRLIRSDVWYDPDPDNRDLNKYRFPELRTNMRRAVGRTASPPP